MKKIILVVAALSFGAASYAQHNGKDMEGKPADIKAMLDGKTFAVTLSENTSGAVGINDDKTASQPEQKDQGIESASANSKSSGDLMTGKKMLIRFENGMVHTSSKAGLKISNCMYNSWGMESTGVSFSADCATSGTVMKNDERSQGAVSPTPVNDNGSVSNATAGSDEPLAQIGANGSADHSSKMLTGTVNGDTIHGTVKCTKDDGSVKIYSYTGSKAGKNDLDLENEMGMK